MEKIAQTLGVSNRTVRYDLEAIGEELRQRGFSLHKKAQKGVWLESMQRAEGAAKQEARSDYYEYILSKKERCNAILVHILGAKDFISAEQLAERLSISRSTLLIDLKDVKRILDRFTLRFGSKRGQGLRIEGGEEDIRRLLIDIFSNCLYDFGEAEIRRENSSYEAVCFREYVHGMPMKEIAEYFIALMGRKKLACYDFSVNTMVVALIVQLKRLSEGRTSEGVKTTGVPAGQDFLLSSLAEEIAGFLSSYHSQFCESAEIGFIIKQLLSSKIYIVSEETGLASEADSVNLMALNIAKTFVEYCQVWLGDIYLDDEELLYNLALHLQPAVKRAKYGIELINPLLPQIRRQYENLFKIAHKAAEKIEKKLEIRISEDEIGYLAVHLGAAIERKKFRKAQQLQVILVCGNGIGTAHLLAMTLKNKLSCLNITKIVSAYELNTEILKGNDIVISTIPLKLEDIAVLHVSPILSDAEIKVIESQIQLFCDKKFSAGQVPAKELAADLTLEGVLLPETIRLDVEAENWEQAVRAAGDLLVSTSHAEPRYVDAMIDCVKKIGPYIVIGPGLAMPHARPEDGVNKVCLSMVRLKHPVNFGSALNDPIDLVFAFGAMNATSHLRVLYEVWQIFQDAEAMRMLRCAEEIDEVLTVIRSASNPEIWPES